jgi:probable F420-dependent oxidoreductase
MTPTALAVALEQRGFDSLWVAEHSHIPVTRRFTHPLGEAELTKQYFDLMDPFVTLSAAAAVTTGLKLGTAVCLVIQRDTIQTAKLVASLDQVSKGRFLFGIGCGWNAEEMEDHGTIYETRTLKMREQIEAMKEIWTKDAAEYHGEIVDFPPMQAWPKPVQMPHPPIIVGGAFRLAARRAIRYGNGILPAAPSAGSGSPEEFMPRWRQMAEEAGRDSTSLSVTLGGAPEDLAILRRNRDLGVTRMTVRLPPAKADEILPILDRWAMLIPQVNS